MMTDAQILANATVRRTEIYNDGERYMFRFTHAERDMAVSGAKQGLTRIDPYRSPKLSHPYKYGADWAVDLTYYGLD